jgi:hypothetical protein
MPAIVKTMRRYQLVPWAVLLTSVVLMALAHVIGA